MEIKIIEENENYLEIECDCDFSLLFYLSELLNKEKGVSAKAFKDHPLFAKPRLIVESENPKEKLKEAIKKFRKQISEVKKALKK